MVVDLTSNFGKRAHERMQNDRMIWLVTTGADGTPQPSPVWFLYHDDAMFIFSMADAPKLRNIRRNPRVALHFDGDGRGGDIVIVTGSATVLDAMPGDEVRDAYAAKYAQWMTEDLGMSAAQMFAAYPAPIRVTVEKVRGH